MLSKKNSAFSFNLSFFNLCIFNLSIFIYTARDLWYSSLRA